MTDLVKRLREMGSARGPLSFVDGLTVNAAADRIEALERVWNEAHALIVYRSLHDFNKAGEESPEHSARMRALAVSVGNARAAQPTGREP